MSPLRIGDIAPEVPGVETRNGAVGLFFYKVTCPTCQMAAPAMSRFERAFPERVVGVGQDPEPDLARFADEYGIGIASVEDAPPYPVSDAYAVESVPTLYLIDGGLVVDVVGAWERDGFNRVASTLASLTDGEPVIVSAPDDGLPAFKPG
jgi:thiol-disulfide isomerase/thioredoxin